MTNPVRNEGRQKVVASICVSSFFGLTLFFFGPTYLYFTNILEYSSSFVQICPFLIGSSLLCILLSTALLASMKSSIHQKALSLIFTVSLLLWLQGNVLVWNYGPLNGTQIDWSANRAYGFIDGAIWILLLASGLLAAKPVSKIAAKTSIAFVLIQLVSTLIAVARAPEASYLHDTSLREEESVFSFSSNQNIVILILDGFQADVFESIINEDKRYSSFFDGFTYYRNAVGGFPYTYASVPLILTGRYYENSVPIQDFIKDVFTENTLPRILKSHGYQVDFAGGSHRVYADETIASSRVELESVEGGNTAFRQAAFTFDVALFRHIPHFVKKYVYNEQSWLFSGMGSDSGVAALHRQSVEFIRKMSQVARVGGERHVFKYIHLSIPHPPFRFNEDLEYEKGEDTHINYRRQAKGSLKLANMFLETLRRIGVYDNSLIFVIADHGWGYTLDNAVFPDGNAGNNESPIPMLDRIKPCSLPLFLVKPWGASGEMQISEVPVSHADIASTIASQAGYEAEAPGASIFGIDGLADRERRFFYYDWGAGTNPAYLAPMREFIVSGFPWLNESWHATYRLYAPGEVKVIPQEPYQYGTVIEFGTGGNYVLYQGWGWSAPEEEFNWTVEKTAKLIIPVRKPESDVTLKAVIRPFVVDDRIERQRVAVSVNRYELGEWLCTKDEFQEHQVAIPAVLLKEGVAQITLELPDAVSKAEVGEGRDMRCLGIRVASMVLEQKRERSIYEWGSPITFNRKGNYLQYAGEGWSHPEEDLTWTNGHSATFSIPIRRPDTDVELRATLSPYVIPGAVDMQRVNLLVNGKSVGGWTAAKKSGVWERLKRTGRFQEYTMTIPRSLLTEPTMVITFELPDAVSPASLGVSTDERVLALAMHSIIITESTPDSRR